jgi:hypothetical protein
MVRKKMLLNGWVVFIGVVMLALWGTSNVLAFQCQADINGDGKVDFKDLEIMKAETGRDNCYTVPCQADLNGDGKVDIEDREILKAEFGRDDCPPSDVDIPREQIEIPQIGQETEFDTGEEEEEVTSYDTGEDEDLEEEEIAPPTTRFKDNGDGTVTDPETGLMWTKDANLPGDTMLFHQALDYIEEMNEGKYPNFGYTDWWLPTLSELRSLIDYTNFTRWGHIIPSGHPFQNVQSLNFNDRRSTTYLSNSDYPLFVSLYCRLVGHNVKSCYGYVWPVRGGE